MIEADIHETAVWNDIMPGSPPKAHAVLHVGLRNTGADTLTIRDCNGLLADARSGEPLRRFTAVMVLDEGERQQLQIAPGATRDVHFRPVRGLPTIDTMRSPRVVLTISFDIGNGRRHALHSPPIQPFLTQ